MIDFKFHILSPGDAEKFELIAGWYLSQWKIPVEKTMSRLNEITRDRSQLQVLLSIDGKPVSTAGIYDYVSLLEKEPRFRSYKKWLALVYTVPEYRGKGYGALICKQIIEQAIKMEIEDLYLYTDTAEPLYARLGWTVLEQVSVESRNIVVMVREI